MYNELRKTLIAYVNGDTDVSKIYSEVLNTFGLPVPSEKETIEEDLKLINSFLELPEKGFLEKVEKHFKM